MIVSERFWEFVDDVNWMEINKNPGKLIKSLVRPILDINKVVEISILPKYSWEEFEQFEKDYRSKIGRAHV